MSLHLEQSHCVAVEYKKNLNQPWLGLNNGISISKMKKQVTSMNKQASMKKKQTLILWMNMENRDEKVSQGFIYIIPLFTDG